MGKTAAKGGKKGAGTVKGSGPIKPLPSKAIAIKTQNAGAVKPSGGKGKGKANLAQAVKAQPMKAQPMKAQPSKAQASGPIKPFGGKGHASGKATAGSGWGSGADGSKALPGPGNSGSKAAAINEIKKVLRERGDGKVYMDNWKTRFGALAPSVRGFMEAHPHLFKITAQGTQFTVSLVSKGGGKAPGNNPTTILHASAKAKARSSIPAKSTSSAGKAVGAGGATGRVGDAIREIKQSILTKAGKVFVESWKQKYGSLGATAKEFMDTRPDLFNITYEGTQYTVSLVNKAKVLASGGSVTGMGAKLRAQAKQKAAVKNAPGAGAGVGQLTTGDAIREIKDSLGPDGKVRVENWKQKYGTLASSIKEFMERYPHIFTITPEPDSNRFTVAIKNKQGKNKTGAAGQRVNAAAGKKRTRPEGGDAGPKAKQAKPAGTMEAAVEEIKKNLRKDGSFWIDGWGKRYKNLGMTPKEVCEANPETFLVIDGEGKKFQVQLV